MMTGLLSLLSSCAHIAPAHDADGAVRTFEGGATAIMEHSINSGLSYVVTFPAGGASAGAGPFAMILFLHSLEERGRRLELLFDNAAGQGMGLAGLAVGEPSFPFVTVSPLCPARTYWLFLHRRLDRLIADLIVRYNVDADRIYLAGVSMGGMGTWSLAMAHADRFAAAAPIAGGVYNPPMRRRYSAMVDVPVWAFHALGDASIPLRRNERAVEQLNAAGGTARMTVIESEEHYIHGEVFRSGELFEWFLQQRRGRK